MKFNHAVKYKGVFYPTGVDVPVGETSKNIKDAEVKEAKAETKKSNKK